MKSIRHSLLSTVTGLFALALLLAVPAGAAQSFVYVAVAPLPCPGGSSCAGQLLVFDAATKELVTTAALGGAGNVPRGMAIAPDGRRLYISLSASDGSASLAVFDTSRHEMGSTYPLPAGVSGPVAVTRDSQRVFVSGGGKLIVWNTQTATVSASLDASYNYLFAHPNLTRVIGGTVTGSFPTLTVSALDDVTGTGIDSASHGFTLHVSMSLDGSRLYNTTANYAQPAIPGDVNIISTVSLQQTGTLQSCSNCYPQRAVDAPTRNRAYVLFDGDAETPLYTYDRTTAQSLTSLTVPNDNAGAVVSGDELRLWIASQRTNFPPPDTAYALSVVNLASLTLESTIPLASSALLTAATPPPGAGRCSYTVSPSQSSWTRDGGTATITLSTGCAWQASENASWLHLPAEPGATSGFGSRTFSVTVDPYFGGDASRSATLLLGGQVVTFTQAGFGSQPAFGSFDTPGEGATGITGSLPVTGWALDDVGVTRVRIFRDAVSGEAPDQVYIGDASLVDGARPDVQAIYPSFPFASRAGWGYLLLTNMLPGGGTGTYRLHAYADDVDGHTTLLGSRTITAANNTATLPFGTLDTPGQGETVSGTIIVWGWALTPQPANIPTDGSTIDVVIDGVAVGRPTYGFDRSDIASLFPGYANTNSAVGYFMLDTTSLSNGVHTVSWVVRDSMGRAAGIGSRYFTVQNP
jgi:hypothetical protein